VNRACQSEKAQAATTAVTPLPTIVFSATSGIACNENGAPSSMIAPPIATTIVLMSVMRSRLARET
jgi:hypothetical protein